MKKIKKILKWVLLSILILVLIIVVFRNEIFLRIIEIEQNAKLNELTVKIELPILNDSIYQCLSNDFDEKAQDPYQYVLSEFKDHDIIFLGEYHRVKNNLLFMQKLIPLLYEEGIRNMGFEFALNKDSLLIKEVITNKDYFDQKKANQIIFNLSPFWGYKEYIDIFRSAWKLNKSLPDNAEPFMIHGIMHDFDYSLMKSRSDEYNDDLMLKVRKGVKNGDRFMADCIINDLVNKNKKALIYCGIHHAFTGYEGHGVRTGVIVKEKIGNRTMTIAFHFPWGKKGAKNKVVYPVNGCIDAFIRKHKSKDFSFGINVNSTSFGNLVDTASSYNHGEELALRTFCDGYIYLNSFSSDEGVTVQENFITKENIDYARTQLPNPELRDGIMRFFGPKVFNQITGMDADIKYRYRHLY